MLLRRKRFSIFLVSFSIIGFELILMRSLSLRFWHHFAYMIISVALLGFGASGTALTLLQKRIKTDPRAWMSIGILAFSLSMTASGLLAGHVPLNVQYLAWGLSEELLNVIVIELLMFLPFFFGGSAIGIALMDKPGRISGHYAANLIGSGTGGIVAVGLMHFLSVQQLYIPIIIAGFVAGILVLPWRNVPLRTMAVSTAFVIVLLVLITPKDPPVSQYKMLSYVRAMPGTKTLYTIEGPLGRIDVVDGPNLHYAPGLGLGYVKPLPHHLLMIVEGDQTSAVYQAKRVGEWEFLDHTTPAAAYRLKEKPRTLIIGAGGGSDIGLALYHKSRDIVALEMNREVIQTMTEELAGKGGAVYKSKAVNIVNQEARGYLAGVKEKFDLVQFPPLDAFGASGAGLYAAQESYLYTVESFQSMIEGLNDSGILCVTRWARTPPRDGLRAIDIAIKALRNLDLEPATRLAVIRNWFTLSIIISRQPLTDKETGSIREFCNSRGFDLCYLPDIDETETNRNHVLDQPYYYEAARALAGPEREEYIENYLFNIEAPTDDKPYYFHFFKWRAMPMLKSQLGNQLPAFLELGYLLLIAGLVQAALFGLIMILLPLAPFIKSLAESRKKAVVLAYFLSIGTGFMLLEICFLQQLIRYLAHPIYSAAAAIAGFLIFGGLGSMLSSRWNASPKRICITSVSIIIAISIAYIFGLNRLLTLTQTCPLWLRFLIAQGLIAPLALAMGHMFPTGLRTTAQFVPGLVPWAWAVNGFASVIATVAAPLIAMTIGFAWLTVMAMFSYLLAGLFSSFLPRG
jgi:hypothetical protein